MDVFQLCYHLYLKHNVQCLQRCSRQCIHTKNNITINLTCTFSLPNYNGSINFTAFTIKFLFLKTKIKEFKFNVKYLIYRNVLFTSYLHKTTN